MCAADMYWTHFMSGHDMSEIRSSASGGVRAPTSLMTMAETGIRQSANTMYAGMSSMLATRICSVESAGAHRTPRRQSSTAGRIEIPQMTVWTMTIAAAVTTMRNTFIAAHHNDGKS